MAIEHALVKAETADAGAVRAGVHVTGGSLQGSARRLWRADAAAVPVPRMRICIVGSAASVHVMDRARLLAELGHAVSVISPTVPETPLGPVSVMSATGRCRGRLRLPWPDVLRRRAELCRLLRGVTADVVYVHYAAGPAAWLAGVLVRGPLAVSVMGGDVLFDEQGSPPALERWLTRRLLQRADLITSKSDFLTRAMAGMGIAPRKIVKVVWGVDLERFRPRPASPLRVRYGFDEADTIVLCPRIVRGFYNVHVLVEALPRLRQRFPRVRLLLTEYQIDPEYRRRLLEQAERLGCAGHVRFLPGRSPEAMPELYNLADAAVSLAPSDGLPQSLFESLACGVPVVLSDLPRYREVVRHGESAWCVAIDPASVAEGLETVLSDAAVRQRLIANGLETVRTGADSRRELQRVERALWNTVAERASARRRRTSRTMLLAIDAASLWRRIRRERRTWRF